MKKILSLFALLMTIVIGAKAEETVIYSWESPEGTPAETGGTATYEHGDGDRLNYLNSGYYTICLNGKKANLNDDAASANAGYINIALDQALAEGDQIKMTAYINKDQSKVAAAYILFSNGAEANSDDYGDAANISFGDPAGTPQTTTIDITAAMAGSTSFKMTRGQTGTNLFITKLEIVRAGEVTKVATPTYTLGAWDAENSKYAVTLNCGTADATIKYSTDNKASYSDYSEALALAPGTTLDAYAVKEGLDNSDAMEQYTVPAAPSFFAVTYAIGEGTGVVPAAVENIEGGSAITLPKNFTMYKEGYTFKGWDADGNGTADYAGGASYTVNADATLTAVFEENTVSLADRTAAVTVKFDFMQNDGAPSFTWGSGTHIWVAQATVAGKTIDVKADIDITTSGAKFDNSAWGDWVQLNAGTKITVPSAEGATVNVRVYSNEDASTVNGNARDDFNSSVAIYNITAADATADVVTSGPYYKYIEVVLPAPAAPEITTESDKTWDINSMFTSNVAATTINDNMEVITTSSLSVSQSNTNFPDGSTFTRNISLKKNSEGQLHIKVAPNSEIIVYAKGGSGRSVKIVDGNENELMNASVSSSAATPSCFYTGTEDADIYISNGGTSNGLLVFAVKVVPATNIPVALGTNGYSTYCGDENFVVTSGATAYTATLSGTTVTLNEIAAGTVIGKGTGIVLVGTQGETAVLTTSAAASSSMELGNNLKGVNAETTSIEANAYVLASNGAKTSFVKAGTYGNVTALMNKAYIVYTGMQEGSLDIQFEGEATAINNVNANDNADSAAPVKVIKNGKLYIGNYNVAGQQVK